MSRDFLLRSWGGDIAAVVALREPDVWEKDGHVACWWFETKEDRERFIESVRHVSSAIRDRHDPGEDDDGNPIDTHKRTIAVVTLKTPDGQTGTFEMDFGYGYPDCSARFMFEEGNYSCDCNRRDFLKDYCDIGDGHCEDDSCGDTIQLVSLTLRHDADSSVEGVKGGKEP